VSLKLALNTVQRLCVGQLIFFGDDYGPRLGILAVELNPLFHVWLSVGPDRVSRAFWFANTTVDAFIGMDHQHVLAFVEAINGADFNTVCEFAGDTVVGDDVGHESCLIRLRGNSTGADVNAA